MSTPKSLVILRRIESRIRERTEQVRSEVHTRWHADGTDIAAVVEQELDGVLFENEQRGLSLPLRDATKMASTLASRLAVGQDPLNPLEMFSVNLLSVLLGCDAPVLSKVEVEAEFGPVTLTHQQPLEVFRRGLQMSMVQSDQSELHGQSGALMVDELKLVQHQFVALDDATGFLKTVQLSGRVRFTASWTAGAAGLGDAVDTLLLTLRHRVEPMQPARATLRHVVLGPVSTD